MEQVVRYLAAVDLFRALDCEPRWRAELTPEAAGGASQDAHDEHARSIR